MRRLCSVLVAIGLILGSSAPSLAATSATRSSVSATVTATASPLTGVLSEANPPSAEPTPSTDLAPDAPAAVLMDAASGQVLWSKNAHVRRPAASVTKLMTIALP